MFGPIRELWLRVKMEDIETVSRAERLTCKPRVRAGCMDFKSRAVSQLYTAFQTIRHRSNIHVSRLCSRALCREDWTANSLHLQRVKWKVGIINTMLVIGF